MIRYFSLIAIFTSMFVANVLASSPVETPAGGSNGYAWNTDDGETRAAVTLKGNVQSGKTAYAVCGDCHLPSGAGRQDGSIPQLAGQHASVLIKQMSDIRSGHRINPPMYPFASELANPQALANVAAYIGTLCIPPGNGKGPGTDLARGKALYDKDCLLCHGDHGEGDRGKFYPVLAGQHYRYMLRQARDIRDGRRHNANPRMVNAIQAYGDSEIEAVTDYMSRLQMPGSLCKVKRGGSS